MSQWYSRLCQTLISERRVIVPINAAYYMSRLRTIINPDYRVTSDDFVRLQRKNPTGGRERAALWAPNFEKSRFGRGRTLALDVTVTSVNVCDVMSFVVHPVRSDPCRCDVGRLPLLIACVACVCIRG